MKSIDTDLERTGAEFRRASDAMPERDWHGSTRSAAHGPLRVVAVAAVVVLAFAIPMMLLGGGSSDKQGKSDVSEDGATTRSDAAAAIAEPVLEDPPYLLLDAEGWEMVDYYETTSEPENALQLQVFRPVGAAMGEATLVVMVADPSRGNSVISDVAASIDLDGRMVTIAAVPITVGGDGALVAFDDGPLVVVRAVGMDHGAFVEAAKQIQLDSDGIPQVVPPAGYERVPIEQGYIETVIARDAAYEGPGGAKADVRIWSGTMADVELQVLIRTQNAQSVRSVMIDGVEAVVALDPNDMSRVWIVGGANGYVMEIDLKPALPGTSDADLETVLTKLRFVEPSTFEATIPEEIIATGTLDDVVAEMLADIPQPPGFDASSIRSTGSRYYVGAEVAGAVTCAWIEEWIDATTRGDQLAATQAVDALQSSKNWAILHEMDTQGDYPEVVWEYADTIADDETATREPPFTIEESYQESLGCN